MKMLDRQTRHRNTNLELFRIVSMLFIVAHHYVVNSGMMAEMSANSFAVNSLFFYLFGAWGKTAINGFVMITGYFMCKSHITVKKFLKLLFEVEFYNILIYLIFSVTGYNSFSFLDFLKAIFPIKGIETDFSSTFLVFYLFIPFLNVLLKNINEKMHLGLISLCLFIYTLLGTVPKFPVSMNYVSWFITVYFVSSYVRLYPKEIFCKDKLWGIATIISIVISSISIVFCLYLGVGDYYFLSDSNKILALVTAFSAFMYFKNVHIPYSKTINTIASATFGVLLIHANSDTMRWWLWNDVLHNSIVFNSSWCYLHFVGSVICIYIICTCIDLIRINFLEKPFFRWYDKKSIHIIEQINRLGVKLLQILNIQL